MLEKKAKMWYNGSVTRWYGTFLFKPIFGAYNRIRYNLQSVSAIANQFLHLVTQSRNPATPETVFCSKKNKADVVTTGFTDASPNLSVLSKTNHRSYLFMDILAQTYQKHNPLFCLSSRVTQPRVRGGRAEGRLLTHLTSDVPLSYPRTFPQKDVDRFFVHISPLEVPR